MTTRRSGALVLVGAVAAFLYSNFILDALVSPDHDWLAVVSELEVPGRPTATLLRVTDVVCALLVLALLPALMRAMGPGAVSRAVGWSLVVFALGGVVAAAVPLPCASAESCDGAWDELQRAVHDGASILSAAALFVGAGAVAAVRDPVGPRWLRRAALATFWVGGVLGGIAFFGFGLQDGQSWQTGLSQRFQLVSMSLWLFCLGLTAANWRISQSVG